MEEFPIIDLNLELHDTKYSEKDFDEFEAVLFYSGDTLEEENEFMKVLEILELDRSVESIALLKKLAFFGDVRQISSFGIFGLARSGQPAIPAIFDILSCDELSRSYEMFDAIFGRGGLINYKDVSIRNLALFKRSLIEHPGWAEIINPLLSNRKDATDEMQVILDNLRELTPQNSMCK